MEKSEWNDSLDDVEKTVHVHCSLAETLSVAREPCEPWRVTPLPMVNLS
ncbi:hypothetical protein ZOD2009_15841 [Haladaptatus paucihalophilus DX253]|uniref:Uncharacterized protein n=1 Tax=Haladaptatus paucihalophilus DX253 TaxID=797209 RepID=E7QWI0_HALPU|nr:hypothetical protein [Haladaptatus paucihalophilus]EFW91076.1 hypothetical protein ZOD2009_15841 [Haladaptatus paucihalophilus DX253]